MRRAPPHLASWIDERGGGPDRGRQRVSEYQTRQRELHLLEALRTLNADSTIRQARSVNAIADGVVDYLKSKMSAQAK